MSFKTHTTAFASLLAVLLCSTSCTTTPVNQKTEQKPKNIILMIGDGMGYSHIKAYRYYADNPATDVIEALPFDRYLVGSVATEAITMNCTEVEEGETNNQAEGVAGVPFGLGKDCINDPYGVTDSAASASAYATGQDTVVERLGISVDGFQQENISERARSHDIAVGIVSTSQVTHATPAAFYSHVLGRRETNSIADQLFDNQSKDMPLPQVILGGGMKFLQREDRDITAEFVAKGYSLVSNRDELSRNENDLVLGLFAPIGLPRAWDRPDTTPSLADMTTAAIKALENNPNGFFLMVEGSQIDWAAHSNDIVGVISEMEDFTTAIEAALEYAANHEDTLVVITADHETGGLSMGRDDEYLWDPRPIRGLENTPAGVAEEFLAGSEPLSVVAARNLPFELTEDEHKELDAAKQETPPYPNYGVDGTHAYTVLSLIFDRRSGSGWTTTGHTGVDVPLYATGPGSEQFHGVQQNEEVGQKLFQLLLPD
jgi:alkaline phosphatase